MIRDDLNKPDLSCPGDHSRGPVGPPGHGTVVGQFFRASSVTLSHNSHKYENYGLNESDFKWRLVVTS